MFKSLNFQLPEVLGKYRIREKLGCGAMGIVYQAYDERLERVVAIKAIPPQLLLREEVRARFNREAVALARIIHPNIVTIFDLDEDQGIPFIVMEYVDGIDLGTCLRKNSRFTALQVAHVLLQAAEGLEFVHKAGIIHRDVKPSNLIISRNGILKILDFGVARMLEELHQTHSGSILGTPSYMSPEQLDGRKTDVLSDQFSLGIVAYELISGNNPFATESFAGTVFRILQHNPPFLKETASNCPSLLASIIGRMLEKVPDRRFPQLEDAILSLRTLIQSADPMEVRLDLLFESIIRRETGKQVATPSPPVKEEVVPERMDREPDLSGAAVDSHPAAPRQSHRDGAIDTDISTRRAESGVSFDALSMPPLPATGSRKKEHQSGDEDSSQHGILKKASVSIHDKSKWGVKPGVPKPKPTPHALQTAEERVQTFVTAISQMPDFPAISQHIQDVVKCLTEDSSSVGGLTNLILKDCSLTLRVLRTANSAYYNRGGVRIVSISHAVVLLGTEAVREIALGIMLLDHFAKRSPHLRQLLLLSLLTANHAQQMAMHTRKTFGIDSPAQQEELYLCGLLRNLGELLVACYYPEKYTAILTNAQNRKCTMTEGALELLGFTFDALGRAMIERWNLSPPIAECMRSWDATSSKQGTISDPNHFFVAFGHDLTAAIYRESEGSAATVVNRVMERYGPLAEIGKEELKNIMQAAVTETKDTCEILSIPLDRLKLHQQMEIASQSRTEVKDMEEAQPEGSSEEMEPTETPGELCDLLIEEIQNTLSRSDAIDMHSTILTVLEAVTRGCRLQRALFCLVDKEHTMIHARLALGEGSQEMLDSFRFPLSIAGGPFALAINSKRDLFVNDLASSHLHRSILGSLGTFGFVFLPLIVEKKLIGGLFADWTDARSIPDDAARQRLTRLRELLIQIIAKRHATH